MRKILVVIIAALPAFALAEQPARPKSSGKAQASGKPLPLKRGARGNPCAEFGPGFAKVEGTDTCMQIGGAVSIGGVSTGAR
jgi:hypothetical protein